MLPPLIYNYVEYLLFAFLCMCTYISYTYILIHIYVYALDIRVSLCSLFVPWNREIQFDLPVQASQLKLRECMVELCFLSTGTVDACCNKQGVFWMVPSAMCVGLNWCLYMQISSYIHIYMMYMYHICKGREREIGCLWELVWLARPWNPGSPVRVA